MDIWRRAALGMCGAYMAAVLTALPAPAFGAEMQINTGGTSMHMDGRGGTTFDGQSGSSGGVLDGGRSFATPARPEPENTTPEALPYGIVPEVHVPWLPPGQGGRPPYGGGYPQGPPPLPPLGTQPPLPPLGAQPPFPPGGPGPALPAIRTNSNAVAPAQAMPMMPAMPVTLQAQPAPQQIQPQAQQPAPQQEQLQAPQPAPAVAPVPPSANQRLGAAPGTKQRGASSQPVSVTTSGKLTSTGSAATSATGDYEAGAPPDLFENSVPAAEGQEAGYGSASPYGPAYSSPYNMPQSAPDGASNELGNGASGDASFGSSYGSSAYGGGSTYGTYGEQGGGSDAVVSVPIGPGSSGVPGGVQGGAFYNRIETGVNKPLVPPRVPPGMEGPQYNERAAHYGIVPRISDPPEGWYANPQQYGIFTSSPIAPTPDGPLPPQGAMP